MRGMRSIPRRGHEVANVLGITILLTLAVSLPDTSRAASPPDSAVAPGSVAAVIERILGSYGGREALERVHSYRVEGTIHAVLGARVGPTVRVFERPDRLKVGMRYPEGTEVRLLDGARGWRNSAGEPLAEAHGPMLEAMVLQACRADVPWILIERGAQARRIEDLEHEGAHLIGIEIPIREKLSFRAYVHPATFRVVMSQGLLEHGGMQTHFETIYDDYRMVEGVLFAFHEENYASGVHTAHTEFVRVLLDPPLSRNEFAPPDTPDASKQRGAGGDTL